MPGLSPDNPFPKAHVVGISLADMHLSHLPPIARKQGDWYGTMAAYLTQLQEIQTFYANGIREQLPILCAGDVFHSWKESHELVNFLTSRLPAMYAVLGQHDLQYHELASLEKTPFYTLQKMGLIKLLGDTPLDVGALRLYGRSWSENIPKPAKHKSLAINVLVAHAYIHKQGHAYIGAPKQTRVGAYLQSLKGYDVAVFGDNHSGFLFKTKKCTIINSGCFIRRKLDELAYKPCVGLICADGSVIRYYLNTSKDRFETREEIHKMVQSCLDLDFGDFVDSLGRLGNAGVDFMDELQHFLKSEKIGKSIRQYILEAAATKGKW